MVLPEGSRTEEPAATLPAFDKSIGIIVAPAGESRCQET